MVSKVGHSDSLILGAGYAGLAAGALLAKRGHKVRILEAHKELGGCGSVFSRSHYTFDAGATTLSGLRRNKPLFSFLETLGLKLRTKHINPGLIIKNASDLGDIKRFSESHSWVNEVNKHFPSNYHHTFWETINSIESKSWSLLKKAQFYPPQNLKHIFSISKGIPKGIDLLPNLFRTTNSQFPKDLLNDKNWKMFIDQLLLISTQGLSDEVPFLAGSMGLNYLNDIHYSFGGMSQLANILKEEIQRNGGEVLTGQRVREITKNQKTFSIDTFKNDTFTADKVISNIPFMSLGGLIKIEELYEYISTLNKRTATTWSAFTAYLAVKKMPKLESLYYQVHQKSELSYFKNQSLFYSFSHPEDSSRCPKAEQCLTISIHSDLNQFNFKSRNDDYKKLKSQLREAFQAAFLEDFSDYNPEVTFGPLVGTPLTFERFCLREKGQVGGLPHTIENPPWKFPTTNTPTKNFFLVGDTTFPGQGIVSVISGAQGLVKRILDSNY